MSLIAFAKEYGKMIADKTAIYTYNEFDILFSISYCPYGFNRRFLVPRMSLVPLKLIEIPAGKLTPAPNEIV